MQDYIILSAVEQAGLAFGLIAFLSKRLLRYLRFLQQEEYDIGRFLSWYWQNKAFDLRGMMSVVVAQAGTLFMGNSLIPSFIQLYLLTIIGVSESDPQKDGKKKLVMTKRAGMIYFVSFLVSGISLMLCVPGFYLTSPWVQILFLQSPPLVLCLAVLILAPRERSVKAYFRKQAHDKFMSIKPFTIGVTGSFGKTSVKNMLGDILSLSKGPTFWPQAGVNTEMGIAREIRERMNAYDTHAVIEMGAYYEGSISRLCQLTPVNAAIVTAVHKVHLERFGSAEQVYKAKSELPQAVPGDGILVVNGDNAGARKMATEFPKKSTYIYGLEPEHGHLDCVISDVNSQRQGTSFFLSWKGARYEGFTKLHGRSALSNIAASFTMAAALGVKPELLLAVIRDLQPVSNRLEVKDYTSFIQINDAYNSNPVGFKYALQVLSELPGKRRILLTPGMIELGDEREHFNEELARQAAGICDIVIIVNEINKHPLEKGLLSGGMSSDQIKYFATRDEGLDYYSSIRQEGDILLLENDLPDLLEFEEKF